MAKEWDGRYDVLSEVLCWRHTHAEQALTLPHAFMLSLDACLDPCP
jgi:hypothetical protein